MDAEDVNQLKKLKETVEQAAEAVLNGMDEEEMQEMDSVIGNAIKRQHRMLTVNVFVMTNGDVHIDNSDSWEDDSDDSK